MPAPRAVVTVLLPAVLAFTLAGENPSITEALTGFDTSTNGFVDQATHDADRATFEERDTIAQGLGPVYNAQSCAECHQNPVSGGTSQVTELRAGHYDRGGNFVPATPGSSLILSRAIDPSLQDYVPLGENIRALRRSSSTLGEGYVECIDDSTLQAIAASQPGQSNGQIAGLALEVPVMEAPGSTRVGRFGWKDQHASLLSFVADAYRNEQGITNRLFPTENTSMGNSVAAFDTVPDPEDNPNLPAGQQDIDAFARFIRASKAPAPDAARLNTADARAGSAIFDHIGCAMCHVRSITTAAPGTVINGGTFAVPSELGNKVIHPFGDFLLHDIGTGDYIVQGDAQTGRRMRTAPLWGLRTHDRFMHDGASLTLPEAIERHRGEALHVLNNYRALSATEKLQLLKFLEAL